MRSKTSDKTELVATLEKQIDMQRDFERRFGRLVEYTLKLPILSLDGESARLLLKVYSQSEYNHLYRGIKDVRASELSVDVAVDKTPVVLARPHLEEALEALVHIGLVTYKTDAEDVCIHLRPLGRKVGFRLSRSRAVAQAIERKDVADAADSIA